MMTGFPRYDTSSMFLPQKLLMEANMNQFRCVKPQKSEHTKVKTSFISIDFLSYQIDSHVSCLMLLDILCSLPNMLIV